MTAIWNSDGSGWKLLSPSKFPDEDTLHTLVEESPQLLPLSGSPQLVIVGREVQLGSGYVDLLAIEPDGRPAVIEIKLAKNSEARRAVVSQVLAYASELNGLNLAELESVVLANHLRKRDYTSLTHALESNDQQGSFEPGEFSDSLEEHLQEGKFRLVIVLDSAPPELVRLVGYLESVTNKLVIDLVTVSLYEVGGSSVLVPQRVDPEQREPIESPKKKSSAAKGQLFEGADTFIRSFENEPQEIREPLQRLTEWAQALESEGLVTLSTFQGISDRWTLLPRLQPQNSGLVTVWFEKDANIQFWRSMFEKYAPNFIDPIEKHAGMNIGQGNVCRVLDAKMLELLTAAYREAASATK